MFLPPETVHIVKKHYNAAKFNAHQYFYYLYTCFGSLQENLMCGMGPTLEPGVPDELKTIRQIFRFVARTGKGDVKMTFQIMQNESRENGGGVKTTFQIMQK